MVTLYQHREPTDISNIGTEGRYMRQYLGVIMQQNGSGIHYSLACITVLQHSHRGFHTGDMCFSMRYEEQKNYRVRREKRVKESEERA